MIFSIEIAAILLVASLLVNIAILGFGKATVADIKTSLKLGSYWKDFTRSLEDEIGTRAVLAVKLMLCLVTVCFLVGNWFMCLMSLAGVAAGSRIARKLYSVGVVNGFVNRIVIYVNKLRNK